MFQNMFKDLPKIFKSHTISGLISGLGQLPEAAPHRASGEVPAREARGAGEALQAPGAPGPSALAGAVQVRRYRTHVYCGC